jgi:hypothetical protein
MLQDSSINRDLYIVINKGQRKVEKEGHLVQDGEEHGERTSQGEMDKGEEED